MHQGTTHGILLINTGTPDAPTVPAVRRYLRQFLMDPRVIDQPYYIRWPLVNLIIAPFRAPRSTRAYQKVWRATGSPLLHHGNQLAAALQEHLGASFQVALGMVVGNPSVAAALSRLKGCHTLTIVPLFPQYAGATWGSVLELVYKELAGWACVPGVRVVEPFYDHPSWIDAYTKVVQPQIESFAPDELLYSFHGLPESQIHAAGNFEGQACLKEDFSCCDQRRRYCYRAHCQASTRALQERLGAGKMVFQSRLGRARWLEPSLESAIREAGARGVKRLLVLTPSFVADCLETLEEIGIHGAEAFKESGGGELKVVVSLNAHPAWVRALGELISW